LISVLTVNAQLNKGNTLISINAGANYSGSSKNNQMLLYLSPGVMKVIGNNFAAGIDFNYQLFSKEEEIIPSAGQTSRDISETFEIGAVAKKYFSDSRFKPYAELGSGYQISNYKRYREGLFINEILTRDIYLRPVVGASYWLNEFISLDANVSYTLILYNYDPFYFKNLKFRLGFTMRF